MQGVMPRAADFKQRVRADRDGFSLHAAVCCGADDRQALEQLCRYITRPAPPRPAFANELVQTNAAGQVVLKLKTAWRDGTSHLGMSPREFLHWLAALVPRPRLRPIRFHGVLAPNANLRAQLVPQEPEPSPRGRIDRKVIQLAWNPRIAEHAAGWSANCAHTPSAPLEMVERIPGQCY